MTASGESDDGRERFDFAGTVRKAREKSALDREVLAAVRAQASGKSREEIAELVNAERSNRHMRPLPAPLISVWVDSVLAPNQMAFRAAANAEAFGSIVRLGANVVRLIRDSSSEADHEPEPPNYEPPAVLSPDLGRTVPVEMNPAEQEWLGRAHRSALVSVRGVSGLMATLHPTAPEDEGGDIAVLVDQHRVGEIGVDDTGHFWPQLTSADGRSRDARTMALVRREEGSGKLQLHVPIPAL